jgi:hypothetical protein
MRWFRGRESGAGEGCNGFRKVAAGREEVDVEGKPRRRVGIDAIEEECGAFQEDRLNSAAIQQRCDLSYKRQERLVPIAVQIFDCGEEAGGSRGQGSRGTAFTETSRQGGEDQFRIGHADQALPFGFGPIA